MAAVTKGPDALLATLAADTPHEIARTAIGRGDQIVRAAYELLEAEGLEGLTIRAVLKRTGLSRRAFYERFAGKDDLVLAVFEQTIRGAARFYGEAGQAFADPLDRLKLIVTSIVLATDDPERGDEALTHRRGAALSREHLRLAEARPDDLQAALRPLIALIAELLRAGMRAGVVREDDAERLATLVYNLVSTTVHTAFLAKGGAQLDPAARAGLAEDIWDFCRRAIAV